MLENTVKYVVKRDGTIVVFDKSKIVNAISKANDSVDAAYKIDKKTINGIAENIRKNQKETMSVEEIQDSVEKLLMDSGCKDVAKRYIIYREERTKVRERNGKLINNIMRRINATDVENANANVDERSFSGKEKETSSDIQKMIAFDFGGLSNKTAGAHKAMLLYQHDAEKSLIGEHNCLFLDFQKLFTDGFQTRNGDVRPPSSFSTACQLVAVAFQCQSQVC